MPYRLLRQQNGRPSIHETKPNCDASIATHVDHSVPEGGKADCGGMQDDAVVHALITDVALVPWLVHKGGVHLR